MRKREVKSGGINLMDFPFGPIHFSETPYLIINYVTPAHQINIQ